LTVTGPTILKARRVRGPEHGGTKINLLLTIIVFGSMIFAGIKIVPAYFANYQLEDALKTETRFAAYNRKSDDEVRDDIWKKVQELGIPVRKEDIHIMNAGGTLQATIDYTIPVDLQIYQFDMHFHAQGDNRSL
jgi:hypothetical protein